MNKLNKLLLLVCFSSSLVSGMQNQDQIIKLQPNQIVLVENNFKIDLSEKFEELNQSKKNWKNYFENVKNNRDEISKKFLSNFKVGLNDLKNQLNTYDNALNKNLLEHKEDVKSFITSGYKNLEEIVKNVCNSTEGIIKNEEILNNEIKEELVKLNNAYYPPIELNKKSVLKNINKDSFAQNQIQLIGNYRAEEVKEIEKTKNQFTEDCAKVYTIIVKIQDLIKKNSINFANLDNENYLNNVNYLEQMIKEAGLFFQNK